MARLPNNGGGLGDWNPLNEHFQSGNVYRRNQPRGESDSGVSAENEKDVFINNIPIGVNEEGLKNLLNESGKVLSAKLVPDRNRVDCQLAFIKTETKADALRIIDHFDGFRINNRTLRVQLQRPRKMLEEEKKTSTGRSGNYGSSDSETAICNPAFESGVRPMGRSQRLMTAALGHEPIVGVSRSGGASTNGFGNHLRCSSSSSEETESSKKSGNKHHDVKKSSSDNFPKQPPASPRESSESSVPTSKGPLPESSRGSTAQRNGSCVKCGRNGAKHCIICKQVYCSRECQREDWAFHKKVCVQKDADDLQVDEEFEKRFSVGFSNEFLQKQTEVIQEVLKVERTLVPLNSPSKVICIVAPFSPSEIYVFLESNQHKLLGMGEKLLKHYSAVENQCQPRALLKVGDLCVSQYSVDKLWYRAEVEAITGQRMIVRYVDYGNKEDVTMSSICMIADDLKAIPYLTVQCSLADLEPTGHGAKGNTWSEEAIKLCQQLIPPCIVATITPICFKNDAYQVEMILPDGTDVAKKLVDAGVARQLKNQNLVPLSPPKQTASQSLSSEKKETECAGKYSAYGWPSNLNRLVGERMTVEFVKLADTGEFWIQFDPIPGHKSPPPMLLSMTEKWELESPQGTANNLSNPNLSLVSQEEQKPVVRVHRCFLDHLPKLELGKEVKVQVTVPLDPANFWCHDLLQMAPLAKAQQSLTQDSGSPPDGYIPEDNEICLGFYDKYAEWYRVKIMERTDDSASVFLVDYGEKITVPLALIHPLPKELVVFPPLAFHCRLSAWNSLQVMSPDVPKHFQDLVSNKPLLCETLSCDQSSEVRSVLLSDLQSGQSIASDLFKAFERKGC